MYRQYNPFFSLEYTMMISGISLWPFAQLVLFGMLPIRSVYMCVWKRHLLIQ